MTQVRYVVLQKIKSVNPANTSAPIVKPNILVHFCKAREIAYKMALYFLPLPSHTYLIESFKLFFVFVKSEDTDVRFTDFC